MANITTGVATNGMLEPSGTDGRPIPGIDQCHRDAGQSVYRAPLGGSGRQEELVVLENGPDLSCLPAGGDLQAGLAVASPEAVGPVSLIGITGQQEPPLTRRFDHCHDILIGHRICPSGIATPELRRTVVREDAPAVGKAQPALGLKAAEVDPRAMAKHEAKPC